MKFNKIKKLLREKKPLAEDGVGGISSAPANVTGANIAGTTPDTVGVPVQNQPGYKKRKLDFPKNPKSPVLSGIYKRNPPKI